MIKKLAAAFVAVSFALALPAVAQTPAPDAAKPAPAKKAKASKKRDCWDLAFDSQAQKDCLAKGDMKSDTSTKKPAAAKKKTT